MQPSPHLPAPLFPPDPSFSPFSLLLLPHPQPCFSVCLDFLLSLHSFQFSSVAQSCPTLVDPMDCSTPGLLSITNSQSLLKLMSTE